MKYFFIFITLLFALKGYSQTLTPNCYDQDIIPEELNFLMEGTAPVINEVNECKDNHKLKDEYIKKVNKPNKGWPKALFDNPLLCLQSMFEGLKDSVEDMFSALWGLTKAFSKVVSGTFWGTYDFLKAAFTGNLSYWFAEASNNASDFAKKLLTSIQAIPNAVVSFVKDKSEDWDCRNDKGQVEMACRIGGYLGTDVLVGVLTLGWNKLGIVNKLKKISNKILPKSKKVAKAPKKKMSELGKLKAGKLEELIPLEKRGSRFVVEADQRGHYSVRYFDEAGNPKYFDGSPFYHIINKRHRRAGVGTNRLQTRQSLNAGEHFTVDVDPAKFQKLMEYVEKKKGKLSVACTRTACESMKAAGVDLGQAKVPSIDKLYKGLLEESSKAGSSVARVENGMTLAQQDALIQSYKTGTNLVKIQFGATLFSGYFYAFAIVGTPMNFVIDRMDAHTP